MSAGYLTVSMSQTSLPGILQRSTKRGLNSPAFRLCTSVTATVPRPLVLRHPTPSRGAVSPREKRAPSKEAGPAKSLPPTSSQ